MTATGWTGVLAATALAAYAVFLAALLLAGRRHDARALAGLRVVSRLAGAPV